MLWVAAVGAVMASTQVRGGPGGLTDGAAIYGRYLSALKRHMSVEGSLDLNYGGKSYHLTFRFLRPHSFDFENPYGGFHGFADGYYDYNKKSNTYTFRKTNVGARIFITTLFGLEPLLEGIPISHAVGVAQPVTFNGKKALMVRFDGDSKQKAMNLYLAASDLTLLGFKTFEGQTVVGMYGQLRFDQTMREVDFHWRPPRGAKLVKHL